MRKNSKLVYSHPIQKSTLGKATYALRSQTIERVFPDAKKNAMRMHPIEDWPPLLPWIKLKFSVMDFKILAIHEWRRVLRFFQSSCLKSHCHIAKKAEMDVKKNAYAKQTATEAPVKEEK